MTLLKLTKKFLTLLLLTNVMIHCGYAETTQSNSMTAQTSVSLQEAQEFIKQTGNEIITILANKQRSLELRKKEFRLVLEKDFDTVAIGRFVLRQYWHQLNDDQKAEYLNFFKNSIVETYAAQFNKYSDQKLEVSSASATRKGSILVKSEVIKPGGGEPLKVVWEVSKKPNTGIKIYDIVINGVSMSITQRSEYASLIQSKGKGIQGLLEYIRSDKKIIAPIVEKSEVSNGK